MSYYNRIENFISKNRNICDLIKKIEELTV